MPRYSANGSRMMGDRIVIHSPIIADARESEKRSSFSASISSQLDPKNPHDQVIAEIAREADRQLDCIEGLSGAAQIAASTRRTATLKTLFRLLEERHWQLEDAGRDSFRSVMISTLQYFLAALIEMGCDERTVHYALDACLPKAIEATKDRRKAVERARRRGSI